MFEKDWTPEQVGRLTMNDLRVLVQDQAPPERGQAVNHPPDWNAMTPAMRAAWAKEEKNRILKERESWET
jgi:hypothetical protein